MCVCVDFNIVLYTGFNISELRYLTSFLEHNFTLIEEWSDIFSLDLSSLSEQDNCQNDLAAIVAYNNMPRHYVIYKLMMKMNTI